MLLCLLAAPPPALAQEIQYRVDIEAPKDLRELLEKHLDVARRASEEKINADEVRRLFARAPERIRALVATEGYFSPRIDSRLDDNASPWKLVFVVDPGGRTVVRN